MPIITLEVLRWDNGKTATVLPLCLEVHILDWGKEKSPWAGLPLSHEDGGYELSSLTSNTPCSSQHPLGVQRLRPDSHRQYRRERLC